MANSSSAYQLNVPARQLERAVKPRPANKVVVRAKSSNNVRAVLVILTIAAIAFTICWRYVEVYNLASELNQKQTQLSQLNAQNSQLSMQIQQALDKTTLDNYAKNTLGMAAPQKAQYVYLDLTESDVMGSSKATVTNGSILGNFFKGIIDYFK